MLWRNGQTLVVECDTQGCPARVEGALCQEEDDFLESLILSGWGVYEDEKGVLLNCLCPECEEMSK